ncbi:type II toxin-antitoxin system HicB family antitoxin [Longimicrobium sp.]|uniref:type II toxin-antitoxin system HicB family antitoxin n=1 Tax=Longimicrobium sp. TaxID=2029185 RepID=UPI002CFB325D|nr:type II toxin-antitoxin system HicB family antitoxin [Longimicrobium sp.]HSU16658.1 type II toxin-antitoxin system HicB family antitoxin [Longimicrobium sp.]
MIYRDYTASYEFDADDGVLHGRVEGIRDIVTFEAERVEDLEREFQISVDVYLEHCARKGREPNRPGEQRKRAAS